MFKSLLKLKNVAKVLIILIIILDIFLIGAIPDSLPNFMFSVIFQETIGEDNMRVVTRYIFDTKWFLGILYINSCMLAYLIMKGIPLFKVVDGIECKE